MSSKFDTPGLDSGADGGPSASRGVRPKLVAAAVVIGLLVATALARYAVDLLVLVSMVFLVGFLVRGVSDALTDRASVSAWSIGAVAVSLGAVTAACLWLVATESDAVGLGLRDTLPRPLARLLERAEAAGWGQRVLLPDTPGAANAPAEGRAAEGAGPAAGEPHPGAPRPAERAPGAPSSAVAPPGRSRVRTGTAGATPPAAGAPAAARDRRSAGGSPTSTSAEMLPSSSGEESRAPAAPTTITLTAWPARTVVGTSVRLTAVVAAEGATTPGGTVVFRDGDRVIGSRPLRRTGADRGEALLVVLDLDVGTHQLSAEYTGAGCCAPSRTGPASVDVVLR